MSRWLRITVIVIASVIVGISLILVAGLTSSFGTAMQLQANAGGWAPDGAKGDTFWDSPVIDVPGFSVTAVHCHGRVRYDVQVGATGPERSNPCYAAMGAYGSGTGEYGVYMVLPYSSTAVYRSSVNGGPWKYSIGNLIDGPPPGSGAPPGDGPVPNPSGSY